MITPRLTVVVPMYNVERYLVECLTSLANQTLTELEVVMVDDGSSDGTAEIAARFAEWDSRFRLVQQPNAGLGAARNTGVRHAHPESDYLAFLDSDDIIPPAAYQICVQTLDRTGSDFLSGNVHLLDSTGTRQSPMHKASHAESTLKTHITRDRKLIYDRLAPNKIFRRTFWDAHHMAFPEGVLYEDIPLTVPAHFVARAVDVIKDPIYYWRQREGGELSITQRRTELAAVRDRIAAVDSVSRFLASYDEPEYAEYKRWYDKSAVASDIRIFIQILPETDEAFRELFLDLATDFASRVDPEVFAELPAIMRLKWHLITNRQLAELLEVLAYEKKNGGSIPVLRRLRRYAKYPFFQNREVGVPDHVFRLNKQELGLRARASEIVWEDGKLRITGHAFINNINVHRRHMSVKVLGLRNHRTNSTQLLPTRTTFSPEVTAASGQARYSYDWAGFEATIPAKRLKVKGKWQDATWRVALGLFSRGLVRRGRLGSGSGGSATHPPVHYVEDNVRLVPMFSAGRLEIRIEVVRVRVTSHRLVAGHLELAGSFLGKLPSGNAKPAHLRIHHLTSRAVHSYPLEATGHADGRTTFVTSIPLADLEAVRLNNPELPSLKPSVSETWRTVVVVPGRKNPLHVVMEDDLVHGGYPIARDLRVDSPDRELSVARNAPGHLLLHDRVVQPVVDTAHWTDDHSLVLSGSYPLAGGGAAELVLRFQGHSEEHRFDAWLEDGRFHTRLTPAALTVMGSTLPMRSGKWNLMLRRRQELGHTAEVPVTLAPTLLDRMPIETMAQGRRLELNRRSFDRLYLNVHSDLLPEERGPYRQKQLRTGWYPKARKLPLRNAVLYDSFTGKQFSDSPRAVYEELVRQGADVEHLWIVRDQQVELPEGAVAIRMWSKDWYEALARAKYIITNAHLPDWIQRRDGQVIVQAWHGTPLKRIGWDIEDVQFANGNYLEKVARESKNWSFLVSPNRFSTPILRRAMRFDGELLEVGYPRNDVLYAPDREWRAEEVRRRIGLPAGRKVVLYAPTWRDDQFYGPGRYKLDLRLDLEKARAELGEDHVLLVRKHPNVVDSVPGAGDGFVWDVSAYPDIADLFLVADILISDYSSLMFDYANTGRPMLFFTYDLEHYRDKLRGFYFDFDQRAPGPLIDNSDELIAAVRGIDAITEQYRPLYQAFQHDFCDLDDGFAGARVVRRMLELGAGGK